MERVGVYFGSRADGLEGKVGGKGARRIVSGFRKVASFPEMGWTWAGGGDLWRRQPRFEMPAGDVPRAAGLFTSRAGGGMWGESHGHIGAVCIYKIG